MEISRHPLLNEHQGTLGWVAVTVGVVLFDYLAKETMSSAADRLIENDTGKLLALGLTAIVACHVLNITPERYDPIHKLAERYGRV